MIANLGNISLVLALVFCFYSVSMFIIGHKINSTSLIQSGRHSLNVMFGLVVLVYLSISIAFLTNDFSRDFIFKNSSIDLPIFYKITGPWGGLEGSLVLWLFILISYAWIISIKYYKKFPQLVSTAVMVMMIIGGFLLSVIIFWSNPLASNLPVKSDGLGLNPLLQDPGMIAHPPLLYLGFVGISVPFAFAISSLIHNKMDNDWILLTRHWSLLSWLFLTMGIIVGGLWAYHVLGWGGYWAWDPVENSSLLPWLALTTFLHSSIAQERTKGLKIWNIALIIIAFVLTLVGTFITRSGIINSVHAFSKSDLGIVFLIFIAIALVGSFGLLIYRLSSYKDKFKVFSLVNRENMFLFNNLIFLVVTFTILYGTIFPLISEAVANKQISIQAPFFNSVTYPFLLIIIVTMGIAPYISWRKDSFWGVFLKIKYALLGSFLAGLFSYFMLLRDFMLTFLITAIYIGLHLTLVRLYEIISPSLLGLLRNKNSKSTTSKLSNKSHFTFKNRRQVGAMIVHLGILSLFIGILGNFFSYEQSLTLSKGESTDIGDYTLLYEGLDNWDVYNVSHFGAVIKVWKDEKYVGKLSPSKAFYPAFAEYITIVDIKRSLFEDLYLSLSMINDNESISLSVYLNRLVLFIPFSLLLFIIGVVSCFDYRTRSC
ncbi:MAG: heme lyase CcmF/NrfE family subunit [SAR324 cluster bacterium]|nr:heme lyase CcmF/NrfE family subunit [SAR324 cluster bacterium]